jgi:ribosomal protein S14
MVNSKKKRPLSWEKSGYKKKAICERCGFRSKNPIQLDVFHIDGSLINSKPTNLKTICANCQRLFGVVEKTWKTGDLVPDF